MKLLSFQAIIISSILPLSCTHVDKWAMMAKIDNEIVKTSFPSDTFNIRDFGADNTDPAFLNGPAINSAIEKCSEAGGGVVLVPKGTWLTGPVTLKSNVNLHLANGATLLFSTDSTLYTPSVLTRWEGIDCYNTHPLIYAIEAKNIAITGKGILDGQASGKHWWWMNGKTEFGWKEGMSSQLSGSRRRLQQFEQDQTPVDKRVFNLQDALRPHFIQFYKCNTVLVEGLTIKNSPFWVTHPLMTDNFILRGVTIMSDGPNTDGCDPESCDHVIIENCFFSTGDDCIAIKSGRNNDGRRWNIPSKNIIVRNCHMAAGHGGVAIGSEISGGYSNLFVENCDMDSPELLRVIRIKSSNCRGGVIENINVRNIKVGQCKEAVLHISLLYDPDEECQRKFPPYIKDITLENVTSDASDYGVFIEGLKESTNISGITVKDCSFNGVKNGNYVKGADRVYFKNLLINGKPVKN
jgi:polygalacturonase